LKLHRRRLFCDIGRKGRAADVDNRKYDQQLAPVRTRQSRLGLSGDCRDLCSCHVDCLRHLVADLVNSPQPRTLNDRDRRLMDADTQNAVLPESYVVVIDGTIGSVHRIYIEALKAGMELKRKFPRSQIKVHDADKAGSLP
jgi:hypothetical protein